MTMIHPVKTSQMRRICNKMHRAMQRIVEAELDGEEIPRKWIIKAEKLVIEHNEFINTYYLSENKIYEPLITSYEEVYKSNKFKVQRKRELGKQDNPKRFIIW